jgi:hypothetical protein
MRAVGHTFASFRILSLCICMATGLLCYIVKAPGSQAAQLAGERNWVAVERSRLTTAAAAAAHTTEGVRQAGPQDNHCDVSATQAKMSQWL